MQHAGKGHVTTPEQQIELFVIHAELTGQVVAWTVEIIKAITKKSMASDLSI